MDSTSGYDKCINKLASKISKWGLGVIVGAGFSKAVIGSKADLPAKNWKELFEDLTNYLDQNDFSNVKDQIVISDELESGETLPQIATKICYKLAEVREISYDESKFEIKKIIKSLVNWIPEDDVSNDYSKLFESLKTKWIITTNYDEVLESILGSKGFTVNPEDPLTAPDGMVPIYHVHGNRRQAKSMIVTHEDYVPLFRPGNYREAKLSTMMTEAPILILGYSLSDLNLLSALDQGNRILSKNNAFPIVLTTYTEGPKREYYRHDFENNDQEYDNSGYYEEISLHSIHEFLTNLSEKVADNDSKNSSKRNKAQKKAYKPLEDLVTRVDGLFKNKDNDDESKSYLDFTCNNTELIYGEPNEDLKSIQDLITNYKDYYDEVKDFEYYGRPGNLMIFNKSIAIIIKYYEGKCPMGPSNFKTYNTLLEFIIYILNNFKTNWFTPKLMNLLTEDLNYVITWAGPGWGKAHEAQITWDSQAPTFHKKNINLWNEIYLQAKINNLRDGRYDSLIDYFDKVVDSSK